MEPQGRENVRFAETPPESPKSCMKGTRKLTFEDTEDFCPESPKSKRSGKKAVVIKSPGFSGVTDGVVDFTEPSVPEFQFHLSQHYDQPPPLPNCTSHGDDYYDDSDDLTIDPNDPQLVEIASRFVNEIIETAKIEVANRQKAEGVGARISQTAQVAREFLGRHSGVLRRANGAISKWISNLCEKAQSIRT